MYLIIEFKSGRITRYDVSIELANEISTKILNATGAIQFLVLPKLIIHMVEVETIKIFDSE